MVKKYECKNCGKAVSGKGRYKSRYCCRACQHKYQRSEYIRKWKAGEVDGLRGGLSISQHIKNWLLEEYGERCSQCGWAEVNPITKRVPVEVDHKDGDHKNNLLENLRLLCPNCHSLTPTYRALNKGNGRASRKQLSNK